MIESLRQGNLVMASSKIDEVSAKCLHLDVVDTKKATHFRPVRYEVQAEMDKIFGLTHAQRSQMRLRHRDEEGRLWYDDIEREEYRHLLQMPRSPRSPTLTRSVSADASNPSSPLDGRNFRRRRSSLNLGGFGAVPVLERKASMSYTPGGDEVSTITFRPLKLQAAPVSRNGHFRREKPAEDSDKLIHSLSKYNADRHASSASKVAQTTISRQDGGGHDTIVLPAFLPLKHHQPSPALLDEAFPPTHFSRSRQMQPIDANALRQDHNKVHRKDSFRRGSDSSATASSTEECKEQERRGVHIGGLRTGIEVYDGVDIPGTSVHLQSDDEDEDACSSATRRARTNKISLMKQRSRLLSAMRGTGKSQV